MYFILCHSDTLNILMQISKVVTINTQNKGLQKTNFLMRAFLQVLTRRAFLPSCHSSTCHLRNSMLTCLVACLLGLWLNISLISCVFALKQKNLQIIQQWMYIWRAPLCFEYQCIINTVSTKIIIIFLGLFLLY